MFEWAANIWTKPLSAWRLLDVIGMLVLAVFTYLAIHAIAIATFNLSEASRRRAIRRIVKANEKAEKMRQKLGYDPKPE